MRFKVIKLEYDININININTKNVKEGLKEFFLILIQLKYFMMKI